MGNRMRKYPGFQQAGWDIIGNASKTNLGTSLGVGAGEDLAGDPFNAWEYAPYYNVFEFGRSCL